MLHINELTCHYGVIKSLDNVNIRIEKNGVYAVIGANGAGKSTLIKTICGIVKPTLGRITFFDKDITGINTYDAVGEGISVCPEGRHVFKSVTVYENLLAGAYIIKDKAILNSNMETVFEYFPRLFERKKQLAGTLSGGEQQMLAIGRAIMSNPKLLLLDEPSMGLAPNLVDAVFVTIVRIHTEKQIPVILVEQNSEMALSIAEYAYVLEVGRMVLEGTGKMLLTCDEVQKKYLGA